MRVLDVVDRIVVALGLGEVEVEVEVLVALARQIEKARRVHADLVHQLFESHVAAAALAHAHLLAAAVQRHELDQRHLQLRRIASERRDGSLHPRNVPVMVRAPHVDHQFEPALQLVVVIGDVRREIGIQAVLALDDTILVVAERSGTEPARPVLRIQMARGIECRQRFGNATGVVQRTLRIPHVEGHAEPREHIADTVELTVEHDARQMFEGRAQQGAGALDQRIHARFDGGFVAFRCRRQSVEHFARRAAQAATVDRLQLRRARAHVVALIPVGREGDVLAAHLEIAHPHRDAEDVHLPAGVVHVVLARHIEAGRFEHVGKARPVGGATTVTDVQRPGRIGGHEFHLHLAVQAEGTASEGCSFRQHAAHHVLFRSRPQEDVDESRTGDLDPFDPG